jgi:hypothetical protein
MSKPDWAEAPEGATHYDCNADVFCTVDGWWHKNQYVPVENKDWGTDRYTPRPVEAWFPIVGERCQVIELPGIYIECEILANRCGDYIYYVPEKHAYGMLAAGAFRPIRTQAQIEREDLEDLLTRASASGLTVKSLVSCIIASGYRLER